MVGAIASCLEDPKDIANMRQVNKRFYWACRSASFTARFNGRVIYPRYACFYKFLSLIKTKHVLPNSVSKIVLVSEGLREHEYGYDWAWEFLADKDYIRFTNEDMKIINTVNYNHYDDVAVNGPFLNGGGYRFMLSK